MCVCTGTDATHAEHIETIKSRNYVGVQSDGHFVPGELGMGLVEGQPLFTSSRVLAREQLKRGLTDHLHVHHILTSKNAILCT